MAAAHYAVCTGRHSHSNVKTFVTQIKILIRQINGESPFLSLRLSSSDVLVFKSNYLYDPCGPFAIVNAILSRFSAT